MATRQEKVVLELEDQFTSSMARAAAATQLLSRELKGLSGQSVVSSRVSQTIAKDTDTIAKSANNADRSINQLTGRLRLFADVAAILGPGLVPIGAVGIPAIAGLANQLGVAALAGGTAIIAFQGVGDALKAVNEASIEPTAENLDKARMAMANLAPAAQDMVTKLQELRPVMAGIRDTAAEGLLPGVIEMFDSLETRVPEVERIIGNMSATLGNLAADAGESLSSERYDEFFDFLAVDAPQTLVALGHTVGDLAHGMAELWMAFDPLNDDFSMWLADVADGFDKWAGGLAQTEGFNEFIDYVRTNGPKVADTFGALADAVLQIVQAAAPLGGPVLGALEGVFKVIGAIADSDLGTPIFAGVAALAAFNRTMAVTTALTTRFSAGATASNFAKLRGGVDSARTSLTGMASGLTTVVSAQDRARTSVAGLAREQDRLAKSADRMKAFGKGAAGVTALGVAASGLADDFALSNTAMLGMLGMMAGPWGAAVGASVGLVMDFAGGNEASEESVSALTATLDEQTGALTANSNEWAYLRLDQTGGLDAARTLGLDLVTVTSAALGNADALAEVKAAMDAINGVQPEGKYTAEEMIKRRDATKALAESLGITTGEVKETLAAERERLGVLKELSGAGNGAGSGIQSYGDAMKEASAAATALVESLRRVSEALSGRASLRDYEQAIDDYAAALKKAKAGGEDFLNATRTGFNRNTQAGRDMEASLDNIASTAVAAASELKGMDKVRVLTKARGDLRRAALDAGLTRGAVRKLIMETYNLDGLTARAKTEVETKKAEAAIRKVDAQLRKYGLTTATASAALRDVATGKIKSVQGLINKYGITKAQATALLNDQASGKIASIRAGLAAIPRSVSSTVTTTYRTVRIGGGPGAGSGRFTANEDGGIHTNGVRTFADGGYGMDGRYYSRTPQIVKGGANILWGEDVTGKEAYISKKPGMEARNIAILNEAASWWGLSLTKRFANGGFPQQQVSPAPVQVASSAPVTFTGPIYATDPNELSRRVEQRLRDAMTLQMVP